MIKHIVLFKLADEAEGACKRENALIIKDRLEKLKAIIPEICKIEVKINHPAASLVNYDLLLDTEFKSFEDLNAYALHPAHLKVVEFIGKVKIDRAAIDYEL